MFQFYWDMVIYQAALYTICHLYWSTLLLWINVGNIVVILVLYIVTLSILSLYSLAYLCPHIFYHNSNLSCNLRNYFQSSQFCMYIPFQWYHVDVEHLLWSNMLLQSCRHIDKILFFCWFMPPHIQRTNDWLITYSF